jgi:hypothetical protein
MEPGKPKNSDLIRVKDAAPVVEELTGVKRTYIAVYQWCKVGRRRYDNVVVKLKTTKRLGTLFTTKEWIADFIREIGEGHVRNSNR